MKTRKKIKGLRAKGWRLEHSTEQFMKSHNANFKRVDMSGQLQVKADMLWIEGGKTFKGEAKNGNHVPAWLWKTLEKDDCDFLVVKRNHKPRLFVLTDKLLEKLLK